MEQHLTEVFGESLQKLVGMLFGEFCDHMADFPVVNRCSQFVTQTGFAGICIKSGRYNKLLSEYIFFRKYSVVCKNLKISDLNLIHYFIFLPRIASVISTARLFSLISCTRTKAHPFMTPMTEVATVPSTR